MILGENSDQLKGIKEDIQKINDRLEKAEERIVSLKERMQNTESIMAEVLKLQTQLEERIIKDQEGRSRRNNIRICGVTEGAEVNSPSMIVFVEDILREKLKLETSQDSDSPFRLRERIACLLHSRQKTHRRDQLW